MTVFTAMLVDAYRELNSRKLFWITIAISAVVVIAYGSIGFNEDGMSVLFGLKQVDSEYINSTTPWARALYVGIFSDFVVDLWLGKIAVILALISTCTLFPDFLAGGAIDVVLSKPIRRLTIFGIKYVVSLLFVVLQVAVFSLGVFLCVGLRLGEWNWMIFAAVPVVTVFYSYLYSVCVLAGVVTRSAITALLMTMLFWFSLWGIQTAESTLWQFHTRFEIQSENSQTKIDAMEQRLDALDDGDLVAKGDIERRMAQERSSLELTRDGAAKLGRWHGPLRGVMVILPKTQMTVGLLSRWLKDPEGFSILGMMRGEMTGSSGLMQDNVQVEMTRRLEAELDSMSAWYLVGTSVLFEAVVLAAACVVFVRRDY